MGLEAARRGRRAGYCLLLLIMALPGRAASCGEQSPQHCLQQHIQQHMDQTAATTSPLTADLRQQWAFELRQAAGNPDGQYPATETWQRLQREENFLQLLRSGKLQPAAALIPQLRGPFHDLWAVRAESLLLEQYLLQVEDAKALGLKRQLVTQALELNGDPAAVLLEIAWHQALGGAPEAALASLEAARVDAFSSTRLHSLHAAGHQLVRVSRARFLDPTAPRQCDTADESLTRTLRDYFHPQHQSLLTALWQAPQPSLAWRNQTYLIRLYLNAGGCNFWRSLHQQHLVRAAISLPLSTAEQLEQMVLLHRTLRRYLP